MINLSEAKKRFKEHYCMEDGMFEGHWNNHYKGEVPGESFIESIFKEIASELPSYKDCWSDGQILDQEIISFKKSLLE